LATNNQHEIPHTQRQKKHINGPSLSGQKPCARRKCRQTAKPTNKALTKPDIEKKEKKAPPSPGARLPATRSRGVESARRPIGGNKIHLPGQAGGVKSWGGGESYQFEKRVVRAAPKEGDGQYFKICVKIGGCPFAVFKKAVK
jgi:hypothetical protein